MRETEGYSEGTGRLQRGKRKDTVRDEEGWLQWKKRKLQ